ncbi:3-hydroxyacyl-CoA dehydrogenase NAD-binding domain-containing protein [Alsobacter sp. SYSU M60028]|uniref:3-hydroxyacyl-CoA dehydrogenase NAD-binding domain-containing protein n=1 Tax=Alsobacter ponti TaxID=2962936 RepID=A0ABT1LAF3_9HYPH|nr:3-hydroxyacyl-CoA dehydrogenase NAD-binding domain-containing protein [Alsobacter ponti]MCP8938477.1 3-hydroxyacyl-CoA dehydrogenase NAD-binding domain-containing protein [Alsobacter ponti]
MVVAIARRGSFAVVTVDSPPVNALSQAVRQGLWDAAEALDADASVEGVVLVCAGRTFIAGADVTEFGKPPVPPHLPDLVARIEGAAKPWTAAIHGSALGGGLEVALGCRFRVALASASLGLPEVTLGLVPGAGGTVRTPRLVGVEAAVDMITTGKPVKAEKARALGLVDAVVDGDLTDAAIAFASEAIGRELPPAAREREIADPGETFWDEARAAVAKRARGEVAPLKALACVRRAAESGFADAMAFERETFLALRGSPQAAALRHIFFAERAAPRPPELAGIEPRALRKAAVVGGGTMGAGIAAALRDVGLPVVLIERDAEALARGLANVRSIYDGAAKRGRITPALAQDRIAGVTGSVDDAALADADIVIEAVFEDLDVKRAVFARLGAACRPDAVLATNTSYLDPRAISEGLPGSERFLGLHFFSPAHVMKLIEIVPAPSTAPDVLATGFALARLLGKIPVRAGICDGFIGNRILKGSRVQVEKLLLSGATPQRIDAAMKGFGMPMGPLEAQDLSGLDISAFQRKAARARGETPFAPVAERLCAMNRLGQKTKGGWYDYAEGGRAPIPSPEVARQIAEAVAETGWPQRAWTDAEIVDMIVLPMVNEGARILEDGIALRVSDIDLVKVHGYGFPRWRGGPMHDAQARGLAEIVAVLDGLAAQGLADAPSPLLRRAAETGHF